MRNKKKKDLKINMTSCFIAFDSKSGDILHVHETMTEQGNHKVDKASLINEDLVKEITACDFEKRSFQVMKLPSDQQLAPEKEYWVDPVSRDIRELKQPVQQTFREVLMQKGEIKE